MPQSDRSDPPTAREHGASIRRARHAVAGVARYAPTMGSDSTPGVDVDACTMCGGTGKVKKPDGVVGELGPTDETACPNCDGTGKLPPGRPDVSHGF